MTASTGVGRGGARAGAGRTKDIHTKWSPYMADRLRKKIQTEKIIKRLNEVATGGIQDPKSPEIQAGLGLLKKVIPDLASVEHVGEGGGAIEHSIGLAWMTEAEAKNRGWA